MCFTHRFSFGAAIFVRPIEGPTKIDLTILTPLQKLAYGIHTLFAKRMYFRKIGQKKPAYKTRVYGIYSSMRTYGAIFSIVFAPIPSIKSKS